MPPFPPDNPLPPFAVTDAPEGFVPNKTLTEPAPDPPPGTVPENRVTSTPLDTIVPVPDNVPSTITINVPPVPSPPAEAFKVPPGLPAPPVAGICGFTI